MCVFFRRGPGQPTLRQFLGLQNRTQAIAWVLPNALVRARCTQEEEVCVCVCVCVCVRVCVCVCVRGRDLAIISLEQQYHIYSMLLW